MGMKCPLPVEAPEETGLMCWLRRTTTAAGGAAMSPGEVPSLCTGQASPGGVGSFHQLAYTTAQMLHLTRRGFSA